MVRPVFVDTVGVIAPSTLAVVTLCVTLFALFLLVECLICKRFYRDAGMFKHWPFYLSAVVGLILLLTFGTTITTVKGMILTLLLLYASLSDLKYRRVPDCVFVMLLILAFVGFDRSNLVSMLAGALVVFIPQLATAVISPKRSLGGADIKISTALAFMLGVEQGLFALIIGLLLAVIGTLISNEILGRSHKSSFALMPYLWIGATLAYMI